MNLEELGKNLDLELDEFIEIVELFLSTANSDIEKILTGFKNKNFSAVSDATHSLKGSSGNLGFSEISQSASNIESNAKEGNISEVDKKIKILQEKINEIENEI